MSKHDISEMDLGEGDCRVRLRRGNRVVTTAMAAPVVAAAPAPATTTAPAQAAAPAEKPARHLAEIKSPTIGTFYAQEKEGAKPYVTVGARVGPTTTVGLIEAMKLFS